MAKGLSGKRTVHVGNMGGKCAQAFSFMIILLSLECLVTVYIPHKVKVIAFIAFI